MGTQNDERVILKTSGGWNVVLSKEVKGSLILTNKRLIIGDPSNSLYLKDFIEICFLPLNSIELTLRDESIKILFTKQSISQNVDAFIGVLVGHGAYDTSKYNEEVSSYTSHWASVLTSMLLLYGEPKEFDETVYDDKKAWCHICGKYVKIPYSVLPVYKNECPICGHRGLTSLSPEDRKIEGEKNQQSE